MKKRMLIDAEYLEETRVVVTNDNEIEDFDHETTTKKQNRGNLYLAKILTSFIVLIWNYNIRKKYLYGEGIK